MSSRFAWYELRTTDRAAARAFYASVLGAEIEGERMLVRIEGEIVGEISELPARAAALGAPSHWLGHLGVEDLDGAVVRLEREGAERRGPPRDLDGARVITLRDPFGAIVALTDRAPLARGLAWHEHSGTDPERALALFAELFGWRALPSSSRRIPFACGSAAIGAVSDGALRPGVHPHWAFAFAVPDLEPALARATAARSIHRASPTTAYVEDPTGAAFLLGTGT